jgi:hypothetical protein
MMAREDVCAPSPPYFLGKIARVPQQMASWLNLEYFSLFKGRIEIRTGWWQAAIEGAGYLHRSKVSLKTYPSQNSTSTTAPINPTEVMVC